MADSKKPTISTTTSPIRAVAGSLALAGFTLALLAGFDAENAFEDILTRAFLSLLGCLLVGLVVGRICDSVVCSFLVDYAHQRPIPESNITVQDLAAHIQTEHEQAAATSKKVKIANKNSE